MKTHAFIVLALSFTLAACGAPRDSASEQTTIVPEVGWIDPASPAIGAVSPSLVSPAMRVTITGSGFGAGAEVLFGGVPAQIVSITADRIVAHPAVGGAIDADGRTPVVVRVHDRVSNEGAVRITESGAIEAIETHPHTTVGDVVALGGGRVLFSDPVRSRLHVIDADGVVSVVPDPAEALSGPRRLARTPDGGVLVFQDGAYAIRVLDPASGSTSVFASGSQWAAGAFVGNDLFVLRKDGGTMDRIAADGSIWYGVTTVEGICPNADDLAVMGGALYASNSWGSICRVDPATGAVAELLLQGDQAWSIGGIDGAGDRLVASGYLLSTGDSAFTIEADGQIGNVTALFPDAGSGVAADADGSSVVSAMGGAVYQVTSGAPSLRAAPVTGIADLREFDGRLFATSGYGPMPAFLAEIRGDGAYRIVGAGTQSGMWFSTARDGEDFLVAAYEEGKVLRIDGATGAVTTAVDHGAIGPVSGFIRDADGHFLVASFQASNAIARYHADGSLDDASFVTVGGDSPFSMAAVGDKLYVTVGGDVLTASLANGGTAATMRPGGVSAEGLVGVAADLHDGTVYVADGLATGDVMRLGNDGSLSTIGTGGTVLGLSVSTDGAILVADLYEKPYRMLP